MDSLLQHLTQFYQLSPKGQESLKDCFTQIILPKNGYLLSEGKTCRYLYFLEKGAIRGYYNLDGKEITHWFAFENDFVTSFHSFITQQPAVENIQLLEGSTLWSISKETLTTLLESNHEMERLLRTAYERYYLRLEERFVNAQFKSATERYESLLEHTPHILERVPLGQVASYLGISQETLSRIRSKI